MDSSGVSVGDLGTEPRHGGVVVKLKDKSLSAPEIPNGADENSVRKHSGKNIGVHSHDGIRGGGHDKHDENGKLSSREIYIQTLTDGENVASASAAANDNNDRNIDKDNDVHDLNDDAGFFGRAEETVFGVDSGENDAVNYGVDAIEIADADGTGNDAGELRSDFMIGFLTFGAFFLCFVVLCSLFLVLKQRGVFHSTGSGAAGSESGVSSGAGGKFLHPHHHLYHGSGAGVTYGAGTMMTHRDGSSGGVTLGSSTMVQTGSGSVHDNMWHFSYVSSPVPTMCDLQVSGGKGEEEEDM